MTRAGGHDHQAGEGGGEVVPFRPRQDTSGHQPGDDLELSDTSAVEPAGKVYDAEIVEEKERRQLVPAGVPWILQPVIIVVRHDRTVRASKVLARNLVYVFTGAGVLAKRWHDRRTKYDRYERSAEIAGDQEGMRYWEERGEKARDSRHQRRLERAELMWRRTKRLGIYALVAAVMLLFLGVAVAATSSDWSWVAAPLVSTVKAVGWAVTAVIYLAVWLIVLAVTLFLGVLWWAGRGANAAPGWLQVQKAKSAQVSTVVTADLIVRALQNLGISKLDKAFKDGWIPPFELPPIREGQGQFKGYRAIFGLPEGVTPTMIADKGEVLAGNMDRTSMETWPSDYGQAKGGRARYVDLYVADRGVMDKPTPTYPLMHEGAADVFGGVPEGITQRGDMVLMPMVGSNFVFGGRPGQGKSNGVRVAVIGCALDPLCEIRVHVFAGNGDFDAYEPRLSRYQKGASKEHAAAAVAHLEELLAEVERREYRLAELGAKKLTRAIAKQHPDMRPLLVVFSECHELFGDKESGEMAGDLAIQVAKRGRKTGVMEGFDTQSSRTNAIPSQLVENMGVNCCYSVKTWRSNDGFLGDGSFAAGIRATELRFNVDRGTMMTTGMTEELFELVRTYFIEVNDDTGWDAATQIIQRAMEQIDPRTRTIATRPQLRDSQSVERDLLEDIAAVLGDEPMPAAKIPALLARQYPTWIPYRSLTGIQLRERLKLEYEVDVPSTDNRWPVSPRLINDARARRGD
jgi:S-DNA-T family DNA segregation ATPase FtsK/SpoIIIE